MLSPLQSPFAFQAASLAAPGAGSPLLAFRGAVQPRPHPAIVGERAQSVPPVCWQASPYSPRLISPQSDAIAKSILPGNVHMLPLASTRITSAGSSNVVARSQSCSLGASTVATSTGSLNVVSRSQSSSLGSSSAAPLVLPGASFSGVARSSSLCPQRKGQLATRSGSLLERKADWLPGSLHAESSPTEAPSTPAVSEAGFAAMWPQRPQMPQMPQPCIAPETRPPEGPRLVEGPFVQSVGEASASVLACAAAETVAASSEDSQAPRADSKEQQRDVLVESAASHASAGAMVTRLTGSAPGVERVTLSQTWPAATIGEARRPGDRPFYASSSSLETNEADVPSSLCSAVVPTADSFSSRIQDWTQAITNRIHSTTLGASPRASPRSAATNTVKAERSSPRNQATADAESLQTSVEIASDVKAVSSGDAIVEADEPVFRRFLPLREVGDAKVDTPPVCPAPVRSSALHAELCKSLQVKTSSTSTKPGKERSARVRSRSASRTCDRSDPNDKSDVSSKSKTPLCTSMRLYDADSGSSDRLKASGPGDDPVKKPGRPVKRRSPGRTARKPAEKKSLPLPQPAHGFLKARHAAIPASSRRAPLRTTSAPPEALATAPPAPLPPASVPSRFVKMPQKSVLEANAQSADKMPHDEPHNAGVITLF